MKFLKAVFGFVAFMCLVGVGVLVFNVATKDGSAEAISETLGEGVFVISDTNTDSKPTLAAIPPQKTILTNYHVFQTFNNCAPAALSMALSHYGIRVSQEELAEALRPYNNLTGNNDDKSTPPDELGEKAKEYGLIPYHRANGDIDLLKQFIANDIPVVIRTLLEPGKDYAHYRVIKGYDDVKGQIIQDDSLQGKNLRYSYDAFLDIWQPFNYAYLVLARPEQQKTVEAILGDEVSVSVAWQNALKTAEFENAHFNKVTALYYLHEYTRATEEFESIESRVPMRTTWYQIEPIQAYFEIGNYDRVFALSDAIFNKNNKAFSELYILRGKSYVAQGDRARAKEEFEKAVLYNRNSKAAREALVSVQ